MRITENPKTPKMKSLKRFKVIAFKIIILIKNKNSAKISIYKIKVSFFK
jgi:hypothetical protein